MRLAAVSVVPPARPRFGITAPAVAPHIYEKTGPEGAIRRDYRRITHMFPLLRRQAHGGPWGCEASERILVNKPPDLIDMVVGTPEGKGFPVQLACQVIPTGTPGQHTLRLTTSPTIRAKLRQPAYLDRLLEDVFGHPFSSN